MDREFLPPIHEWPSWVIATDEELMIARYRRDTLHLV